MKSKKKAAVYSIEELTAQAKNFFHADSIVVKAALITCGKKFYTEKEAAAAVKAFRTKEVK